VVMPMTQLVRQGEPPTLRHAAAIDGDDGSASRADDSRFAIVDRPIVDNRSSRPRDGVEIDLIRLRYP
jgi:hypothetical protein